MIVERRQARRRADGEGEGSGGNPSIPAKGERDPLPQRRAERSPIEIAKTCPKIPVVALVWKTCGKAGCRCRRGALHGPYWSLRWRERGRHCRSYVRPAEFEAVRMVLEGRRAQRALERTVFAEDLALLRHLDRHCRELDAALAENRRNQ
jgi:hypothetical protein